MAKRQVAAPLPVKVDARLKPYVVPKEAREAGGLTQFYRINNADEAAEASKALAFIKERVKAIKGNPRLVRLVTKAKAALDAAKASYAEVKSIETDACNIFLVHDGPIRNELARFQTAAERARQIAQPKITQRLTRQLTQAAQPLEVEAGDDVFEFTPDVDHAAAVTTLQPIDTGATMVKHWKWALVDPDKRFTKEGAPNVDAAKGLKALVEAVAKGEAALSLLRVNEDEAQYLADSLNDKLNVPGLAAYFEMRPRITGRSGR